MADPTYTDGSIDGIGYDEVRESMALDFTASGIKGLRVFRVRWADRTAFLKALVGEWGWKDNKVQRFEYPQTFPGYSILVVQEVHIRGGGELGISGELPDFEWADVSVLYMPREYEEDEDEEDRVLATEQLDFSAEALMVPAGGFKWGQYKHTWVTSTKTWDTADLGADAGKPLQQQTPILIPKMDLMYSKVDLATIPMLDLIETLGRVNSAKFQDFNPGYVLFAGASSRRQTTVAGQQPYELTLVFSYRSKPWNFVWNPNVRQWASTDPAIYESADFSKLLKYTGTTA